MNIDQNLVAGRRDTCKFGNEVSHIPGRVPYWIRRKVTVRVIQVDITPNDLEDVSRYGQNAQRTRLTFHRNLRVIHSSNYLPQLRNVFVTPPALLVTKRPCVLPCGLPHNFTVLLDHLGRVWTRKKIEVESSTQHPVLDQRSSRARRRQEEYIGSRSAGTVCQYLRIQSAQNDHLRK